MVLKIRLRIQIPGTHRCIEEGVTQIVHDEEVDLTFNDAMTIYLFTELDPLYPWLLSELIIAGDRTVVRGVETFAAHVFDFLAVLKAMNSDLAISGNQTDPPPTDSERNVHLLVEPPLGIFGLRHAFSKVAYKGATQGLMDLKITCYGIEMSIILQVLIGRSTFECLTEAEVLRYETLCKLLNFLNPYTFETRPWTRILLLPSAERLTIFEAHVISCILGYGRADELFVSQELRDFNEILYDNQTDPSSTDSEQNVHFLNMSRYIQTLLGLAVIWSLEDDAEQERLLSLSRILNFLRPTRINMQWRPVPLMPGSRRLTPFELQTISCLFGYTDPRLSSLSPEEQDHFNDILIVVRFFAPHIIEGYEQHL
ncbi:hypothetical protein QR680_008176 [Steinernema hermaphroditum]|uniref:Uncharacterized protein n=1 Tax=Steinernema hermaphroditum TaxID=289476 RepID=A0AA39M7L7_9BILA|nr:hypothetical protein QR680_008176 [Steinernema hermaphroditum]